MYYFRIIYSTMKYRFITFYRVFHLSSFALRFFAPLMAILIAWVLFNNVFGETVTVFSDHSQSSDYLTFILIGNAIYTYVYGTVFVLGRTYFWDQLLGIIEPRLMTPSSRTAYMIGTVAFGMLNATIDCLVVMLLGLLIFQVPITLYHPELLVIGLAFLVISMFGLGLVINGITCTLRDRVNTANTLSAVFFVFSGVIVPLGMLPIWGQIIGRLIPLTYALQLIRLSTVSIIRLDIVFSNLIILIGFSIILTLIGVIFLNLFEQNLKRKADLTIF
ncbi:MAG: ABC transporter permease [Candidatus Hermodarchaeota archaeon]